jgi:hypothetical protein
MVQTLSEPEIVRCFYDDTFQPRLTAMCLNWRDGSQERLWELPDNVCLAGPPPEKFGVSIQRRSSDTYAVRMLWNQTGLFWPTLTRAELLGSALAPLLGAMGTDLWHMLEQPIAAESCVPNKAA